MNLPGKTNEFVVQSDVFSITKKNVYFGSEVIQNQNISSVGRIVEKNSARVLLFILGAIAVLVGLSMYQLTVAPIVVGVGLIIWAFLVKDNHGLVIEMNSGGRRIVTSKDDAFIKRLVEAFYEVFESDSGKLSYKIDIQNQQITTGPVVVGDIISGNENSSIISKSNDSNISG